MRTIESKLFIKSAIINKFKIYYINEKINEVLKISIKQFLYIIIKYCLKIKNKFFRKFLKGGNKKYTKNEKKKFQEKLKNKERRENQKEKNKIVKNLLDFHIRKLLTLVYCFIFKIYDLKIFEY